MGIYLDFVKNASLLARSQRQFVKAANAAKAGGGFFKRLFGGKKVGYTVPGGLTDKFGNRMTNTGYITHFKGDRLPSGRIL